MMAEPIDSGKPIPAIIALYDKISRTRPLTKLEVVRLDRAIRRARSESGQRQAQPWNERDERRLRTLLLAGKKPAEICLIMRRTERAIWRRMCLLGWTVRKARQGSIPMPRRKVDGE